jgi:hypothetical protein
VASGIWGTGWLWLWLPTPVTKDRWRPKADRRHKILFTAFEAFKKRGRNTLKCIIIDILFFCIYLKLCECPAGERSDVYMKR